MSDQQCCRQIWGDFTYHQCSRKAKVERDGEHYCTIHDPVRRGARAADRSRIWRERRELEDKCRIANTVMHAAEQAVVSTAKRMCGSEDGLDELTALTQDVEALLKAEELAQDARERYAAFQKENPK